jgi:hypothetical protein
VPTERFDPQRVAEARARAQRARQMKPVERGPWRHVPLDPARVVEAFAPALRLRAGIVLHTYARQDGLGGGGRTFAFPEGAVVPDPESCLVDGVPAPPGAIAELRSCIEGDGSAWWYLCASLCARELWEIGATWHAQHWTHHVLVMEEPPRCSDPKLAALTTIPEGGPPRVVPGSPPADPPGWTLAAKSTGWPTDWRPEVIADGDRIEVRMCLYSGHLFGKLFTLIDTYARDSCVFESREEWIAGGPPGFVY